MKKIVLLSIICLMFFACGKSPRNKIIGLWEFKKDSITGIWEISEDSTIRFIIGDNRTESGEWELFEESSGDNPSLVMLIYEDDGELETTLNIEFLADDKILVSRFGRKDDNPTILNRIEN